MIDAKELRIGNWVKWLHEESESYKRVDAHFIAMQDMYDKNPDDDIFARGWFSAPIPLTPEILEKAGFEEKENDSYINGYQYTLQVDGEGRDGVWFDGIGTIRYPKSKVIAVNTLCRGNYVTGAVDKLHQLQNLYRFLCGEELEINL